MTHVDDSVDPVRDLETIQYELCQKDLVYVESAIEKENKDIKKNPQVFGRRIPSPLVSALWEL